MPRPRDAAEWVDADLERMLIRAFVDHAVLAASGIADRRERRCVTVVASPDGRHVEQATLAPMSRDEAVVWLRDVARDLLGAPHAYFFPCEAVFVHHGRPNDTTLVPVIEIAKRNLRDADGSADLRSAYGPVPRLRDYPIPDEAHAPHARWPRRPLPGRSSTRCAGRGPPLVSTRRVARPAVLARIPADRHAVIEASAGTGKTFTLEHLVVDLLLGTDVTLDQILVVTFTEKATIELRARVRATLDRLVTPPSAAVEPMPGSPAWAIDDAARDKLAAARGAFEAATITTIHAFCQRVLRDNAFFSGRLFEEEQVDGRDAFARAFREALRRDVATHPERTVWLEAALRSGASIDEIEQLLWSCAGVRGEVRPAFDPAALAAALDAFPVDEARSVARRRRAQKKGGIAGSQQRGPHRAQDQRALAGAVERAREACAACHASSSLRESKLEAPDLEYPEGPRRRAVSSGRTAAAYCAAAVALVEATPTFEAALANAILPAVLARVASTWRKRDSAGEYDFDDMLTRVDEALRGPSGPALGRAMRRRWRYALIDEFQDTDEVQWRIFHRAFFDPEPPRSVVYLVGDPKQSIYRFRGADVETYLAARQVIVDGSGTRVALDSTFRATPAMAGALNTIFDQEVAEPVFTGAVQYEPVTCGRTDRALVDGDGNPVNPVHLFRTEGNPMPDALGPFIAREIAAITAPGRAWRLGDDALQHSDIFVLTRNRYDGRYVAEHLRKAGIPFAFFKEDGLFTSDEAKDVAALLRAVEAPRDKGRRFAAWLTPFFGLTLAGLEDARELPATHPYVARLGEWKALGDARDYGRLFESVVRDSGLVRREIFFEDSERENQPAYPHLRDPARARPPDPLHPGGELVLEIRRPRRRLAKSRSRSKATCSLHRRREEGRADHDDPQGQGPRGGGGLRRRRRLQGPRRRPGPRLPRGRPPPRLGRRARARREGQHPRGGAPGGPAPHVRRPHPGEGAPLFAVRDEGRQPAHAQRALPGDQPAPRHPDARATGLALCRGRRARKGRDDVGEGPDPCRSRRSRP